MTPIREGPHVKILPWVPQKPWPRVMAMSRFGSLFYLRAGQDIFYGLSLFERANEKEKAGWTDTLRVCLVARVSRE
jgi:hypothetical protein